MRKQNDWRLQQQDDAMVNGFRTLSRYNLRQVSATKCLPEKSCTADSSTKLEKPRHFFTFVRGNLSVFRVRYATLSRKSRTALLKAKQATRLKSHASRKGDRTVTGDVKDSVAKQLLCFSKSLIRCAGFKMFNRRWKKNEFVFSEGANSISVNSRPSFSLSALPAKCAESGHPHLIRARSSAAFDQVAPQPALPR